MVLKVFSIFDVKASVFSQPFFSTHNGTALRSFSDLVGEQGTSVCKHPEDFKLYCLGEYDDNSGALLSKPQPEFLANASDFVKSVV